MVPHPETWREAGIQQVSSIFRSGLTAVPVSSRPGTLPLRRTILTAEDPSVVPTSVRWEDGSMKCRFYRSGPGGIGLSADGPVFTGCMDILGNSAAILPAFRAAEAKYTI